MDKAKASGAVIITHHLGHGEKGQGEHPTEGSGRKEWQDGNNSGLRACLVHNSSILEMVNYSSERLIHLLKITQ